MCLTQQVLGFAYAAPVQGTVTDGFGWRENAFHYGTDIAADAGTVISSFADGTVTAVGDSSQLGNYVTVSHAGAFTTLYAHCSRITASSGQQVALGDPIAEVGETGQRHWPAPPLRHPEGHRLSGSPPTMALAERLRISPGVPLLLAAFVWLASPLLLGAILSAAVCHELGHWLVLRRVGGRIQRLLSPCSAPSAGG